MIIVWLHILTQVSYVTLSTLTPRPKNALLVLFCLVQISECDYLLSGGYFRDIWRYKKKPVRGKFGKKGTVTVSSSFILAGCFPD